MQLSVKAYAKINWSLGVIARRADGYHELDMLMQTIELCDELSFAPARMVTLSIEGQPLPGGERNLIVRAAKKLSEYAGVRSGARIYLIKRIPVRSGLGGGSADCAATLLALNKLWRLNLPMDILLELGASLGSDVPYCMNARMARVGGVGDKIETLDTPPRAHLVILHPGGGLSTGAVFEAFDKTGCPNRNIDFHAVHQALMDMRYEELQRVCHNALEATAERMMPQIVAAKRALYDQGALFAQMSGSGSAVFGVFPSYESAVTAKDALGPEALLTATR